MIKKSGNFFEEHVEKIVLAIVGVACMWFLVMRVIISPNYVSFDNEKFSPGAIDNHILKEHALALKSNLNDKAKLKEPYKSQVSQFYALVDTAISSVDMSLVLPVPNNAKKISIRPIYALPDVGEVTEVVIEPIRAVAYVPTEEITEENTYYNAQNEPNDIDFVTVQAKFDVAGLYERFYESFAGEDVKIEWRDPCLAEAVFAATQLQRQELAPDGLWGDWQIVPRTIIDHRKKMFELIENAKELPAGGINVRLLQFDDTLIRTDLLQPIAYEIASPREAWYPPLLHKRYSDYQKDSLSQEKRQAREEEMAELEKKREETRDERERVRSERKSASESTTSTGDMASMLDMMMGGGPPPTSSRTKPSRTNRRRDRDRLIERRKNDDERPVRAKDTSNSPSELDKELSEIALSNKTKLSDISDGLVFWAHDDTVEPEKTYRYRLRLGVFNPVAGITQVSQQSAHLKDNVVLWSTYSNETESVKIPGRLYFFPRNIQEAAKTVTVQVSKYMLGYWYSTNFTVKRGETIGKSVEYEPKEGEEDITVPAAIDYGTRAVLVDVMGPVKEWMGTKKLRERLYNDMLYSFDGFDIEHLPIKPKNWSEELRNKFNEINKAEKEAKEARLAWGGG